VVTNYLIRLAAFVKKKKIPREPSFVTVYLVCSSTLLTMGSMQLLILHPPVAEAQVDEVKFAFVRSPGMLPDS
jgi:hypothetical protein